MAGKGGERKVAKVSPAAKSPQAESLEADEPILRSLDRWWFGYGSPTSLGIFRICIATLVFLNLLTLTGDLRWWYGENGFVPAWVGQVWFVPRVATPLGDIPKLDLISGVTDFRIFLAFFAFTCVAAFATALGLFTRYAAFALALCLVSLHHRNPIILHGGDTAMRIAVLYLAVSPSGRACSLDRLFRLRRGEEDGPVEVSLWGQRLVQFNTALIYFTTVWAKWFGTRWLDGTATWYPARLAEFQRFPVPGFMNDLPMVYLTTYGTVLLEFSLGTLVFFRPLRKYVLFGGVMLHAFIEYSMNVPFFSYLMVSYYVCFYDGEEIAGFFRRLGERLRPLAGLEVTLPTNRRLSPTGERFLAAIDPMGLVRYLPGAALPSTEEKARDGWSALKDNGKPAHPFRGVAYRAPGAWVFLVVPGLWRRLMTTSTEAVS